MELGPELRLQTGLSCRLSGAAFSMEQSPEGGLLLLVLQDSLRADPLSWSLQSPLNPKP